MTVTLEACAPNLLRELPGSQNPAPVFDLYSWGTIGIMENQMETTIVYWVFISIMENKMEATIAMRVSLNRATSGLQQNKLRRDRNSASWRISAELPCSDHDHESSYLLHAAVRLMNKILHDPKKPGH